MRGACLPAEVTALAPAGLGLRHLGADDLPAALALARAAFGDEGAVVAGLVEQLATTRTYAARLLVALDDSGVVGLVGLTDGWIDAVDRLVSVPVLSPLAVAGDCRGKGLGRVLVEAACALASHEGAPAVVLEGDPAFYGRLGFEPAADRGVLRPSSAIPEAAFQWRRLASYAAWMRGRFVYPDVFWRCDAVGLREDRRARHTGVEVSTVTLGAREPVRLARFYADLLGGRVGDVDPDEDWVAVRDLEGWTLAVQLEPDQSPAVWPAGPDDQHMQAHLEIRADDLDAAVARAVSLGARVADHQPQPDVCVMLDPEGHPFCLWVETE